MIRIETHPEGADRSGRLTVRPLSMPVSSSLLLAAAAQVKLEPIPATSVPPPPAPPPAPVLPSAPVKWTADAPREPRRPGLASKFQPKVDPREELLNSIRKFTETGRIGLKKVKLNSAHS